MRRLSLFATFFIVFISFFTFVMPVRAYAAVPDHCKKTILGLPTWFEYLDMDESCSITGPNKEDGSLMWPEAIGYVAIAVVEIMLRLAGLIAVGFVIYGGFRYIVSQGEPDGVKAARETIINAVVGLVIAIIAAAVVNFIARTLSS